MKGLWKCTCGYGSARPLGSYRECRCV